jgi:rhodanese-related sulfurtransferase
MGRAACLILVTLLALCMAAPAWTAEEEAPLQLAGAVTVNAEQIIALIKSTPEMVIIDSRKPEDFTAGAIEGAVLLTDTHMTPDALAEAVPSKATPVLFYCNGLKCGRAANAAAMAVAWGYRRVYYYALGMTEWHRLGLPVVKSAQ